MPNMISIKFPGSDTVFEVTDAQARIMLTSLQTELGTLSSLDTTTKTSLVAAINEIKAQLDQTETDVGHAVHFDDDQDLTSAQKEQARTNIDAAGAGEVADLKSAVDLIEYSVNPNNDGEFIWELRYGYWSIESESLLWHPANDKFYVASAYPIKVKSGDAIHIKDPGQIRFFAEFSENGSTWSVLASTTAHDVNIPSDGYVLVNARKNPAAAFTEKEVELFFDSYLTIYRKTLTNNVIKQIDNINDAKGVIVNDVSFVQSYVTESTSTTEGAASVPIEFPAAKGETFIIGANISVTHPEYFSKIILSVRERYNNQTISDIRYDDLTQPIEYTVQKTNTASIVFVIGWVKQSDSSVDIGYYENFDYSIYVTKKNDDFSDVMTESGNIWEV